MKVLLTTNHAEYWVLYKYHKKTCNKIMYALSMVVIIVNGLIVLGTNWDFYTPGITEMPRLDTVENCMKLSQMVTQALEAKSSPLQQLPHIRPDMLRHFVTKRVHNFILWFNFLRHFYNCILMYYITVLFILCKGMHTFLKKKHI